MPEALDAQPQNKRKLWTRALRLIGLALLILLLLRVDTQQVIRILRQANLTAVAIAITLTVPLIWLKTIRWQIILQAQGVRYRGWPPFLAYFGSLFVGFLTPGRLGEFVKAFHVQQECGVSLPLAFTSVLADRLFDLVALTTVGVMAIMALSIGTISTAVTVVVFVALIAVPLLLFLNPTLFGWLQKTVGGWGKIGPKLFGENGWLTDMHTSLRRLTPAAIAMSAALTILAYGVFYTQNYLLARALGIDVGFVTTSYAVALGSLVTLIPISISGLGAREAVMIIYLGSAGVSSEEALGFSLLIFFTFYICGGLIGLVAWLIKPIPWSTLQGGQEAVLADVPVAES